MNSVFKNSSYAKSFIRYLFSLSESSFPSVILTILYIVSVSDISSSIFTDGVENNMCTGPERKPKPPPYEGSWGTDPIKKLGPP